MEKPKAPSILQPPVLQDIKLRTPTGPPPMVMPQHAGGFPTAKHRTERRYAKKGTARTPAPMTTDEVWDKGQMTTDPLPDKVLQDGMLEENSVVAASAVMLRSRNSSQRNACLSKLLAVPHVGYEVATSDPTVAAQFILALRLALDADSLSQQADVIRILEKVTERKDEASWHALLQTISDTGRYTSLSSWYDERTVFGLGVCKLSQPTDPIASVPKAQLWEPIESLHELASVAQCEMLDTVAKTQYSTRLRYLLTHPSEATPWVPLAILNIFHHLSLSRSAAEALAAAPKLIETLINIISPAVNDESIIHLSEVALLVLTNFLKSSAEVAVIVKENGAISKATSVIAATVEMKGKVEGRAESHVKAALMFLRNAVLAGLCSKHMVPGMFGSLAVLARCKFTEAVLVFDAQAVTYNLEETLEGKQQVGLIDFALRDIPPILATMPLTADNYYTFSAACMRLIVHATHSLPGTVTNLEHLVSVIESLLPTFSVSSCSYALLLRAFKSSPQSTPNCVRWEPLTVELKTELLKVSWANQVVRFLQAMTGLDVVVRKVAEKGLERVIKDLLIPDEVVVGLGEAAVKHSLLPKRDSRINAAILRPVVSLAAAVAQHNKMAGVSLNLSLFLQPADGKLFTELLSVTMKEYPALQHYFTGSYTERLLQTEPLFMRYRPGRLEPQLEWPFVAVVDVPEDEAEGRMLTVKTKYGTSSAVLLEWGSWLSNIVKDPATYLTKLDWREAVLRSTGIFNQEGSYMSLLPYLAEIVEKRTVIDDSWSTRMGESPIQPLKRFLQEYESGGGSDGVYNAVCLLFLGQAFPKDFRTAIMESMGSALLCHAAGTCFGVDATLDRLWLGLGEYIGKEEMEAEEAKEAALMISVRDLNPANLLHVIAVHKLSAYVFEEDSTISFMSDELLAHLPPRALYHVALYAPSPTAIAAATPSSLSGYLASSLMPVDSMEAVRRLAALKGLGLPAYQVFEK